MAALVRVLAKQLQQLHGLLFSKPLTLFLLQTLFQDDCSLHLQNCEVLKTTDNFLICSHLY